VGGLKRMEDVAEEEEGRLDDVHPMELALDIVL
jgi:hypothetical protein